MVLQLNDKICKFTSLFIIAHVNREWSRRKIRRSVNKKILASLSELWNIYRPSIYTKYNHSSLAENSDFLGDQLLSQNALKNH